jgi:hypothetical protein
MAQRNFEENRMRLALRLMVFAAAAMLAGSAMAASEDYAVRLSRAEKVGNEFHLSAAGTQSTVSTVKEGGKIVAEQSMSVAANLEATAKVIEIDKTGMPSKLALTVEKFGLKTNNASIEVLPKGTVISACAKDDKRFYEVEGKAVADEIAMALDMVVSLGQDGLGDDEIFGAKDRKKAGDEWPVNADAAAKDFTKKGLAAKKENVTGTVRLEKAEKVSGTDCLDVRFHITVGQCPVPPIPDFATESATLDVTAAQHIPVEASARAVDQTLESTMKVVSKGKPKGTEAIIEVTDKMSTTVRFSPIPAPAKAAAPPK